MRLLIKSKPGVTLDQLKTTAKRFGGKHNKRISDIDVDVFEFGATNINKGSLISALAGHSRVQFVEEDQLIPGAFIPNDPYYGSEWHLTQVGAPTAWDTATGTGVVIAVLDAGCDPTHPDLVNQYIPGWNIINGNTDTADITGHGTAVAGTVAAQGNNASGVCGVAFNAKIMPVRITNDSSGNGYAYWSDIANAVTWAANHGAHVITNSYGSYVSTTVQSAAQYAMTKGAVMLCAAMNDGVLNTTAASPYIITVSATQDATDAYATWSTYGPAVDVSAPGYLIYSTARSGGIGWFWGTSFSTPIVAGVAALIKSAKPSLTPYQIRDIITSTAVDLGPGGRDDHYGYGRVDAAAAVAAAVGTSATVDTTAPTVSITAPANSATVQGTAVSVTTTSSDAVGVTKVELYVNGALYATSTVSPYSFTWNSTAVSDGSAALVAKAYDAAGNVGTSSTVTVTVSNTVDSTPPVPVISSPANNSTMPSKGNVNVTASATDNIKVASLSIKVDGVVKSTVNAPTLTYKLNPKSLSSGAHTITATAVDSRGNSASTSITVNK